MENIQTKAISAQSLGHAMAKLNPQLNTTSFCERNDFTPGEMVAFKVGFKQGKAKK